MAYKYIALSLISGKLVDSSRPTQQADFLSNPYISLDNFPGQRISRAYAKYNSLSDTYKYARLISAQLYFPSSNSGKTVALFGLPDDVDLAAITWNNAPSLPDNQIGNSPVYARAVQIPTRTADYQAMSAEQLSAAAKSVLSAKTLALTVIGENTSALLYTNYNDEVPTIRVVVDPENTITSQVKAKNSPTSGYVNPRNSITFEWGFDSSDSVYKCAGDFTQKSATFYWKKSTESTWTAVSAGTEQTITIAANTFPAGVSINWRVQATDNTDNTTTTPTYTISTAAAAVYTTPIAPADSIEANDGPITFRWSTSSADGFRPGTTQLQWSTDESTWRPLASERGNSYSAPENTFPSGTIYWRVATYNIDGVLGPQSDNASFIAFGAPAAPTVTVQAGAFAVINWQAQEQEAYRVTVDGTVYGPFFGSEKSYALKDPLSPGEHVATVEVQNSFGLWSQPGTATFSVVGNIHAAPEITNAVFREDATISWTAYNIASTDALYVYRDGVKIASLSYASGAGTFTDRFALGTHSYQLIQKINGYAARSKIVTGTCKSCTTRIAALAGGEWIELRLSENSQREEAFGRQRAVSLRHFSGASYPVAEIGPYQDGSGTYDVAFTDVESAAAFEALFGQPVIVKSRGGNVVVGAMSNLDKRTNEFYINYTFTIQRIYWRDYVDLTDN